MTEEAVAKKAPVAKLYAVRDRKEKDSFWSQIGAAFENKDGSLSLMLNALPIDGRMQLRYAKNDKK